MTTDNIIMWVTRPSIVVWDFSKAQTLLETLKIRNQLREESYVSFEDEHLSPPVGCARSKRQSPTVLQKLKSFRWMLDCELTAPNEKSMRDVDQLSTVDYVPTITHSSQGEFQLYIISGQRSCHQDDYQSMKSNNETRVQNRQSCA